jgi:hypothetical protein
MHAVPQVSASQDKEQLQHLLAAAAAAEQELRRQALEITFLTPEAVKTQPDGSLAPVFASTDVDEDEVEEDGDCYGGQLEQLEQELEAEEGIFRNGAEQQQQQQEVRQREGSRRDKTGKVQRGPARMAAKLGLPLKR